MTKEINAEEKITCLYETNEERNNHVKEMLMDNFICVGFRGSGVDKRSPLKAEFIKVN